MCLATPAAAQDARAPAERTEAAGAWLLVGADAGIGNRWRASARVGYLSELDTRLSIVDVSYVAAGAVQLIAGHVYLDPERASSSTSVARGGAMWLPVRRRIALDNRFLVERRFTGEQRSLRGRDRVRLSWSSGGRARLVISGSFEGFVNGDGAFVEHRYQGGAARHFVRATAEGYWVQRRTRGGLVSNSLGLTMFWRVKTR